MSSSSPGTFAETSAIISVSGKKTPMKMTAIFSPLAMPNQMIKSGMKADAGM